MHKNAYLTKSNVLAYSAKNLNESAFSKKYCNQIPRLSSNLRCSISGFLRLFESCFFRIVCVSNLDDLSNRFAISPLLFVRELELPCPGGEGILIKKGKNCEKIEGKYTRHARARSSHRAVSFLLFSHKFPLLLNILPIPFRKDITAGVLRLFSLLPNETLGGNVHSNEKIFLNCPCLRFH